MCLKANSLPPALLGVYISRKTEAFYQFHEYKQIPYVYLTVGCRICFHKKVIGRYDDASV